MSPELKNALDRLRKASLRGSNTTLTPAMVAALVAGPLSHPIVIMERAKAREKGSPVTIKLANQIRALRLAGMTYSEIMKELDVSMDVARRYSSDVNAQKMREYQRARHKRLYSDPAYAEQLEKKRQRCRDYAARNRRKSV